jgi:hypothetical protein
MFVGMEYTYNWAFVYMTKRQSNLPRTQWNWHRSIKLTEIGTAFQVIFFGLPEYFQQ